MPRIPNPPRKGHPAKPRRERAEDDEAMEKPARSYGQSAPMPEHPTEQEQATMKPVHRPDREADIAEREELEDLTLEPTREEAEVEDEENRRTTGDGRGV